MSPTTPPGASKPQPTVFVDLTHTLSTSTIPQTLYPGHPPFELTEQSTILKDGYNLHVLSIGTHTGTHIDAPSHFIPGARSVDQIPLEELIGRGVLLDLSVLQLERRHRIVWEDFERAWSQRKCQGQTRSLKEELYLLKPRFLLIRTGWSEVARTHIASPSFPFHFFGHPYLSSSIASELLSLGVKAIAIDTPNPDETPFDEVDPSTGKVTKVGGAEGFIFHHIFLGGDGLIIENMAKLEALMSGENDDERPWIVNVIPLKLERSDGSPVRAYAYREGSSF
ncbi:cyclase [Coprinopsis sp. MPI-PUGE-AT-0042]|nr:cyclase [Coprinopsis sp. MPI-PUGE-AT-0042]